MMLNRTGETVDSIMDEAGVDPQVNRETGGAAPVGPYDINTDEPNW